MPNHKLIPDIRWILDRGTPRYAPDGQTPVEGPWVDRVNGIENVQVDIVMMRIVNDDCFPKLRGLRDVGGCGPQMGTGGLS